MKGRLLFTLCLLFTLAAVIYAQETPAAPGQNQDASDFMSADIKSADNTSGDEPEEEKEPAGGRLTPEERQRTELEVKSSTMPELAVWCRSLGLSEGGTKEELAKRIRDYFGLPEPNNSDDGRKILIIESAQSTEYFTVDVIDEDYARLKGDVRLILHDKEDVHKIKADEVLFNRTRNIITAKGKVEYIKEKGDTTEIFRGENITVNIDDWDSVFLDGDSEKTLSDDNTAYRFEGTVISRSYDDVVILNNARISNANNEEALWSITASKLWLLPGSDFAIYNMVLKVGEILVLYFPFFYYSADDLVFHPVIGYRSREGGFVQTTTYIMGRPKGDTTEQSSITKILGSSADMEKEPNGIFLRSTGKKAVNTNDKTLKLMADYYVNLGAYAGIDFSIPRMGILNSFDLSAGAGFSRTLTKISSGDYTPYAKDGSVEWNNSNLFSNTVPFRYRMKTQSSLRGTYGSLSWTLPYYSDPFIDRDFFQSRAEAMDWVNMIQQGSDIIDDDNKSDLQPYSWQLNGNISPSVGFLSPYVSGLSISNITTSLAFKVIDNNTINNIEHPGRKFFAPDKYTIYNVSGSVSGTPLSIGKKSSSAKAAENKEQEDPLKNIGALIPPWEENKTTSEKKTNDDKLAPPVLNKTFDIPRTGNSQFSAGYQLSPSSSSELQFMTGSWKKSEDINWNEVQSILSNFSGNGNINFNLNHSEGLFSNSLTFSGSGTLRDFNYLNEEADIYDTEAKRETAKKQQYALTNYSSLYAYNTTLKPLYKDPIFGQSNIQYSFGGTLVKSKKYDINTVLDGPELTPEWGTLKKEQTKDGEEILGIRNHRLASIIAANIMDKQQSLTVSADLPPLDPLIQTNASFRAWFSTTTARIDFKKPEILDNLPNNEWKIEPLYLSEIFDFGSISRISYSMAMEPEDDFKVTNISASLSLWAFNAVFSAVKLNKWEFIPDKPDSPSEGGKWVQQTDEEPTINPRDLTISYRKSLTEREIIKNRLGFSINVDTRLFYDLQRHTNSNFQFSTGFALKVNNFLDLTMSATSENAVVFRYFKNVPGMEEYTKMYIDGPQNNIFLDLADSFNFFDNSKRQRSGFKMKRFNLTAVHHLGDWDATFIVAMSPYLDPASNPPKYDINAEITFLVQWSAISEIKTDLKYEKRYERWTQNK